MEAQQKKQPFFSRNLIFWLLPAAGTLFLLWYVKNATADVVYSDYIRLVNSYLPDVYNPDKFFVPDILTRLPINYLERIVNVELFGFSITLDRVLGVVSLGLAGAVFSVYAIRYELCPVWFAFLMVIMFSLNKWEMLTNGSGWSHFFAFACFYYHELILDRVWNGREKRHDRLKLILLPWFIILGTAGPYCGSYGAVMLLSYGFCFLWERAGRGRSGKMDLRYLVYMACTLIPLLLYIVSSSFAVEEHAGATGRALGEILSDNPAFPVMFILKSLAGMVIGGEQLSQWSEVSRLGNIVCYLLGLFVAAGYLSALWMNWKRRLYEETLLPLMLLAGGGINHILIFLSRYIFEKTSYGLSSRYALQFQVGILGIFLTFALVWRGKEGLKRAAKGWILGFCLAILLGNGYTTYHELRMAPYREESFEAKAALAREIPGMSDEELEARKDEIQRQMEYFKGADKIRDAFRILEENGLNVFR